MSNRWQMLAGYTYSQARIRACPWTSARTRCSTPRARPALDDRPHQFKLTGTYILPYDIYLGANYRLQNGPPINRQLRAPLVRRRQRHDQRRATGDVPARLAQTIDLRLAKTFRFAGRPGARVDMDISNLTNANTAWELRSLTGRLNVRQGGDPNGEIINIQQFRSPTQILGPRIIRFAVSFRF